MRLMYFGCASSSVFDVSEFGCFYVGPLFCSMLRVLRNSCL